MMKGCELCPATARMYCESDQASLCFDCDAKVHGANFLVARHSRSLLCRSCQSPTPWRAAGPRLNPTVSICDRCVAKRPSASKKMTAEAEEADERESGDRERLQEDFNDNNDDVDFEDDDDDEEEIEEDDDDEMESEDENEEGEEQVVPLTAYPPPVTSSSSSEEESRRVGGRMLKSMRENNVDLISSSRSQNQLPCSSSSSRSYFPNRSVAETSPRQTRSDR